MTKTFEQSLAEVIALEIAAAIEPLQRKVADLDARDTKAATQFEQAERTIAELQQRLTVAEARPMTPGPTGPDGRAGADGKDGSDGIDGKDGAAGLNGTSGKDGLNGKDGRDGLDGKHGSPGLDGKDGAQGLAGKDGRDGLDGKHGQDGVGVAGALLSKDGALVLTLSDGSVRDLGLVRGEPGRDGLNGTDGAVGSAGKDGRDGLDGKDGASGLNGKDGRDGMPGVPGRSGLDGKDGLDGKAGAIGAAGKDGKDGLNGKDGLGFDQFDLSFDEHKGWLITFARGTERKTFQLPVPFDAGIWESGRMYPKGAGVTRQGAFWIAQRETNARPGDETDASRAWRLSVKGGRDGKPGKDGRDGSGA